MAKKLKFFLLVVVIVSIFIYPVFSADVVQKQSLTEQQSKEILTLANELESVLKDKIWKYWFKYSIDNEDGGFLTCLSRDWTPYSTNKTIIGQFRMVYVFSRASIVYPEKKNEYIPMAKKGIDFIIKSYWDKENEGWYLEADKKGNPINKNKKFYAQLFCIYSFSTYYLATKDPSVVPYIEKTFDILQKRFYNKDEDYYICLLDEKWKPLDLYPPWTSPQMGDHLHYLEAMLALYEAIPKEEYKMEIRHASDIVWTQMWDDDYGIPQEFFTSEMEAFDPKDPIASSQYRCIGHQTEQSFLLMEASRFDKARPYVRRGISLLEQVFKYSHPDDWGYGIVEWQGYDGKLKKEIASLWCQSEGINACAKAFYHTGDYKYIGWIKKLLKTFDFYEDKKFGGHTKYIVDPEDPKDFTDEKREKNYNKSGGNTPYFQKGHGWACCYHTTRSLTGAILSLRNYKTVKSK